MKKLVRFLAITLLATAFSQPLFAADNSANANSNNQAATTSDTTSDNTAATSNTSNKKVMSTSSIVQQLQKAGYIVKSVDFNKDDNQYKVEAVDKRGDKQSLDVDATQGLSADMKKTPKDASLVQIIKKYEKNGSYVKSVTLDNGSIKLLLSTNKVMKLTTLLTQ